MNLRGKFHFLRDFLYLFPSLDIDAALLDHDRYSAELDDVTLSHDVSLFCDFLLLTLMGSFLEFADHIRLATEYISFSTKIFELLGNKFILSFDLLGEIELQILVLIDAVIRSILENR